MAGVSPATPSGRAARVQNAARFVERGSILMRHTGKQKWARKGPILVYWRARQDSNL